MTTLDPHTQHRKLAALANFLDDLPSDRFHIPKWASPDATETSCGTAGCVAGWAATKYNSEGWSFSKSRGCHGSVPIYGRLGGSFAMSEFFCIRFDWAINLCSPFYYKIVYDTDDPTPRIAAEAIRMCLREVDPAALEPEQVCEAVPA